jgi:methylene-tetrahydromethanopterin dehydrogenase
MEKAEKISAICNDRYQSKNVSPGVDADKQTYLKDADIVLNTGAAGIQLMTDDHVKSSDNLKICADTNAVPPSGIAGVDVMDSGKIMEASPSKCRGIGALAIGNVKYKSQHECLKLMYTSDKPVYLDFEDAFKFAQKSV